MRHITALLAVAMVGDSRPASAQETPTIAVSGGYQLLDAKKGEVSSVYPIGWYADAVYSPHNLVGIVAQVGGGYDRRESVVANEGVTFATTGDFSIHDFTGGVRLNGRPRARDVWFVQALAGGVLVSGDATTSATGRGTTISNRVSQSRTYFGLQFGGGVNLTFSRRVGVRAGADVLRIFHTGEEDRAYPFFVGNGTNVFRFTAGFVLPLARR
jgi:hypothetical protein